MDADEKRNVLILGAGINGCALARELALNGVGVWLVDANDIAFGATSRSSRLVHGGLRYLEYADIGLVRQSLRERARLLRLAPQFVEPIQLYIPIRQRTGGLVRSVFRFLGGSRSRLLHWLCSPFPGGSDRGLWIVRIGLWAYDRLAGDERMSRHHVSRVTSTSVPKVDAAKYRWLCAYTDAQMRYPERFVIALLEDARQLAQQNETDFCVWTHHRVTLRGDTAEIRRSSGKGAIQELKPSVVVNATGAWGDLTLSECHVASERLFGGTKGSHFVTHSKRLRQMLGDAGVYAEASDSRLVFLLPFGEGVLVGSTDEKFDDRPEHAVARQHEVDYLIEMVNALFPTIGLTAADDAMHYSGVRPLPHVSGGTPAAIPRGHRIVTHETKDVPVFTLVGGKLTTCRALAEEAADKILDVLNIQRTAGSRERIIPGGDAYPTTPEALRQQWERLAGRFDFSVAQVRAVWSLCGNRAETILREIPGETTENLSGTDLPIAYVRWVIRHEWVMTLDDLVERRLMLVYDPALSQECLHELAGCLVESNRLVASQLDAAVETTLDRLRKHYGKRLAGSAVFFREKFDT